jgi:N-acetylneuraminate synthase
VTSFPIGRHQVGDGYPTYFVADIAANHDGDLQRAVDLVVMAAEAGADAAKFQNFRAETIVSDVGFRALGGKLSHQASWEGSVTDVYAAAALPMEWTSTLRDTCDAVGIDYFTAPYDLDLIEALSPYVCAWKVGSGDITWHEAIATMAKDGKPLLLATGASSMDDVRAAMAVAQRHARSIVLMQCNTNYSADLDNFRHIELNVLKTFASEFPDVVLGLSDHTPGHATVLGAVTLGARVVEKHFTDDTTRPGPDHPFSLDAATWRDMVDRTRELELALGGTEKRVMDNEQQTAIVQRRAIRAARTIAAGETIGDADVIVLRPCPADALAPYRMSEVVGRVATQEIAAGDCVRLGDLR